MLLPHQASVDMSARLLSDKLRAHGIAHVHEEFDGGHLNTQYRYDRSFAVITHALYR